ncbi:4'-phosphopantetheinyl transferase family protein [Streptomyces sp. NPDC014773]|uniref:4'-phosphopantetheinyl transferase family protein n=1 Tax=Streptomyces sp. NPDC014773 TaxID=3364908 RepID=UPI0036FC9547
MSALLDVRERQRVALFASETDRRRFTVAHGAKRTLLGRVCGLPPDDLGFGEGPEGRPFLSAASRPAASGAGPVDFSLSHSGSWALLGILRGGGRIGVDIERVREDLEFRAVAGRFFQPAEARRLRLGHPGDRAREFFRLWTRKEAFLKVHGRRLGELAGVTGTPPAVGGGPETLWFAGEPASLATGWEVAAPPGYTAAVAVTGPRAARPRVDDWPTASRASLHEPDCEVRP